MEKNRAFLFGDAVSVYFFVRDGKLILAEECYFFLMASMRKMRMHIPLTFTLEYFTEILEKKISEQQLNNASVHFLVYRQETPVALTKSPVQFFIDCKENGDILEIKRNIEVDLLKEISVNTTLLNHILTHCPENIYAEIYAKDNDLDELLLLNPQKRIARGIFGNFLFLENNTIRIPKQSEGAYISPLMENLVTFIHKNRLAEIEQAEMSPFESQKAEEILLVSDRKGLFSVSKIRNKTFENTQFQEMVSKWRESFNL
ncbi:MAG: aminotransferase class IV [Flavobacteriaceae bacterium]|nr:aminotransferase class IV [Flavobacteriaceae bacterium]